MADLNIDDVMGVLGGVSRETSGMPEDKPLSIDDVTGAITDIDKTRTRQSVFKGVREDPDKFAKDRATADRSGLPVEAVRQDRLNVESRLKIDDVMGVLEKAPVTKAFMNDENNAKIAHDDVESLSTFEKAASVISTSFERGRTTHALGLLGVRHRVDRSPETMSRIKETKERIESLKGADTGFLSILDSTSEIVGQMYAGYNDPALAVRVAGGGTIGATIGAFGGPLAPGTASIGAVAGMGTGLMAHMVQDAFAVEGGLSYIEQLEIGIDEDVAAATSLGVGVINAGLEVASATIVLKPLAEATKKMLKVGLRKAVTRPAVMMAAKQFAKSYGAAVLSEVGTEVLQESVNIAAEEIGKSLSVGEFDELTTEDVTDRLAMIAEKTFKGMLVLAAPGPTFNLTVDIAKARQVNDRGGALRAANDAAMQSKLNQRDPARAAAHRADVLRAQGIETVSIDAESVNTFFQGYMSVDDGFIEKLGITELEMSEAVAIGGDIEISVDAFAEHLYGTERFNDIADFVRLGAESMTVAEANQYEETGLKEQIANLDNEIDSLDTAAQQDANTIRSEVEQMMTEAGQAGDAARFAGSLVAAEYATTAQRAGVSALDLWKQDRLSILGPESAVRFPVDDLTILLDKARSADADTFMGLSKTPALDMLIGKGGVDPDGTLAGELKAVGVTSKTKPGIFRKGGLGSADNLVQSEAPLFADMQLDEDQGGYIPVDEIVEAVREELAGAPRRTIDEAVARDAFDADIVNLTAALDEAGITLDATEAEIRAALGSTTFEQGVSEGPRGSITFDTKETIIRMFNAADKSTFLHESGHLFLDHVKRNAEQFGKTEQFVNDWETVKKWWGKNAETLRDEAIKYARANKDDATITALGKMSEKAVLDYVRSGNLTGDAELYQGATIDDGGTPEVYLTRAMHEQWARGVEDYFRTGQAPSVALQDAFNRFRAWLVSIYSSVTRRGELDVQLPPDVKQVLDRLLATDEEIALVEEQYNLKAFFESAQEAGMTQGQWATYQRTLANESEDAKTRQLKKKLNDIERAKLKWWKEETARVREGVEAEVHAMPAYKILYAIIKGTEPSGEPTESGFSPNRLDKAAAVEILDNEESLARLPSIGTKKLFATGKEASVHPNLIAAGYGYDSGRAMLLDLMNTAPMEEVIAAKTEALMKAEYGDMNDNAQAVNEAIESVHADKRGEVLAMELNQLRESGPKMKPAFVRQWAKDKIGRYKVDAIRPDKFLAAERKHGKEAGRLLRAGDRLGAQQAKFRQIMNFYMAKEAYKERGEIDKSRRYMEKFTRPKKTFKKIDADYVDKIKLVLEAYGLGPRLSERKQTILELQAMNEWIMAKEQDDGAILQIPARILEANEKTHYRDLTLDDFRELVDSIHNIETQGKLKKKNIRSRDQVEFNKTKEEMLLNAEVLKESAESKSLTDTRNPDDYTRRIGRKAGAALKKIEFMMIELDGKFGGAWHQTIFQPAADSEVAETAMVKNIISDVIMKNLEEMSAATKKKLAQNIDPEIAALFGYKNMDRGALIMMALNVGTDSNYSKMLRGSALDQTKGSVSWSEANVENAISKLSKEEWGFVQSVWVEFEKMRPLINDIYRQEYGVDMAEVPGRMVKTPYGEVQGGYIPMMYDSARSNAGKKIEDKNALEGMQSEIVRSSLFDGMTKARIEGFAAPVDLNLQRLPSAMTQNIHYITHYDAVRNIRKFLNDGELSSIVKEKFGNDYYTELTAWAGAVASGRFDASTSEGMDSIADIMRNNVTAAALIGSYTTLFAQTLGLFTSATRLAQLDGGGYSVAQGATWLGVGIVDSIKALGKGSDVFAVSGEMASRIQNFDRDNRKLLKSLSGKGSKYSRFKAFTAMWVGYMQMYSVDLPTWRGAYARAISENKSNLDAEHFADMVVRTSQGGGSIKDLANVQRRKGVAGLPHMFYTYFSVHWNLVAEEGNSTKNNPDVLRTMAKFATLIMLPALADEVMRGNVPDDEAEPAEWLDWAVIQSVMYLFAGVPVLGPGIRSAYNGFDPSVTPATAAIGGAFDAVQAALKMYEDGEITLKELRKIVLGAGMAAGVPFTVQISRFMKAMDKDDPDLMDFLHGPK